MGNASDNRRGGIESGRMGAGSTTFTGRPQMIISSLVIGAVSTRRTLAGVVG